MKCSGCKHAETVDNDNDAKVCKLNPPSTLGIPQVNKITGETAMAMQPTNPLVTQGNYDNGGCSHHEETMHGIDLS